MPINVTDVIAFTSPIQSVATGDSANQANFLLAPQGLANRTAYLNNAITTGDGSLVAGSLVIAALSSASPIPVTTALTFGTNPASAGSGAYLRFANNTTAIAFRNQLNTADLTGLWCTSSNGLVIGDTGNVTSVQTQASTSISAVIGGNTQWTLTSTTHTWSNGLASVNVLQASSSAANATGAAFSISAQNVTGTGTTTGGALNLNGGTATGGTNCTPGNINFNVGAPTGSGTEAQFNFSGSGGNTNFFVKRNPGLTGAIIGSTGSYLYITAATLVNIQQDVQIGSGYTYFFTNTTSPNMWLQGYNSASSMKYGIGDSTASSITGGTGILAGQNVTGTTSTGGDVIITSGTGTTAAGFARIQCGGVDMFSYAPLQGTTNSQIGTQRRYTGYLRTTTSTATTAITIPVSTSGSVCSVIVRANARDVTSGTVGDGFSKMIQIQVKNVAGTVTSASGTSSVAIATTNDTSMATCAVSFNISGTSLQITVAGLAGPTIDWVVSAEAIYA